MTSKVTQNKENEILIAAELEFLTKGFDGARTTSIANSAGVTHAMLHYYFRTKEQLFERIVNDKLETLSHSMATILGDSSQPIIDRIKGGIESHFDFISKNPLLPRFIINEIISRPERYEILNKQVSNFIDNVYKDFQNEIDKASARGEVEKIDIRMLLISIMSLNIFTFVAYPFMEPIMGDLMTNREDFLQARKLENVETILRRIKKS